MASKAWLGTADVSCLLSLVLASLCQGATGWHPSAVMGTLTSEMTSVVEAMGANLGETRISVEAHVGEDMQQEAGEQEGAKTPQPRGADDDTEAPYKRPRPVAPGFDLHAEEELDSAAHGEATLQHGRRLQRVLRRARAQPRSGARMSKTEALARAGDGRIYVVGHPEGPPRLPRGLERSSRHVAAAEGFADISSQLNIAGGRPAVGQAGASNADVTVTVQTKREDLNYRISPYIYGVNEYGYKSYDELQEAIRDAGMRFVRRGGDIDTRWNWAFDTKNSAADWYFQNYPQGQRGNMTSVDLLLQTARTSNAEALFTIPMLGWLPKARDRSCSFSMRKYGQQRSFDPWTPDCGNGVLANGTSIQWNDVRDSAALYGPDHQTRFVQSVVARLGRASEGGIKFYCLDNEPVWWSYVHWDIKKDPSTYNEILERGLTYAALVKSADPTALILGPVSGGWSDVFFSITDMQNGWATRPWKYFSNPVDRRRHGDVPHLQWYLENFRAYELAYGRRILDIVDIHGYVAGNAGNDATDAVTQANRIATTRIYWDPTFSCSTTLCDWVDPITAPEGVPCFLVRVQEMIDRAYPGLGLALTEYSFGGNDDVSGAIAQAETLGVFGKLGLTIATVFPGPTKESSVYKGFKIYGNYDGRGSQFGELGVSAVSSNTTAVSCYAAINSARNVLTVLVINLTPTPKRVDLNLVDVLLTQPIKLFRYDASNLAEIVEMPPIPPATRLSYSFNGYSLNMLEVNIS